MPSRPGYFVVSKTTQDNQPWHYRPNSHVCHASLDSLVFPAAWFGSLAFVGFRYFSIPGGRFSRRGSMGGLYSIWLV